MLLYSLTHNETTVEKAQVVDDFTSCVWTDRYSTAGDCTIVTKPTLTNRQLFTRERWFGMSLSDRIMVVKSAESTGSELIVTCMSLEESALRDRVVSYQAPGSINNPWILRGDAMVVMGDIFAYSAGFEAFNPKDKLPLLTNNKKVGYSFGELHAVDQGSVFEVPRNDLYSSLVDIAQAYMLGFRLYPVYGVGSAPGGITFDVYSGINRSRLQTVRPAVEFSERLNSLDNARKLESSLDMKTVAYVYSKNGFMEVTLPNTDTTASYERKVMLVDASDVDLPDGSELQEILLVRGEAALNKQRAFVGFDGEVPPRSNYIYGKDYSLGDLVTLVDGDNTLHHMVVTEQIFSMDASGFRTFPTLSTDVRTPPDTWLAWDPPQTWATTKPEAVWNDPI